MCLQIKCFFLWVDVLAQTLINELLDEHEEWLPIMPQIASAGARATAEETEGGGRACIDREVAIELRRVNPKISKLEDQSQICNFIWAVVFGIVIALGVMLTLNGKA
uniref:Uncharacterized protein n=1 Tax=Avena sativa TaxID=4498 RepID=A0ACD5VD01_AVESA